MSELKQILDEIKLLKEQITLTEKKQEEKLDAIRLENKAYKDELNHTWHNFTQPLLFYNVGSMAASMYHDLDQGENNNYNIEIQAAY